MASPDSALTATRNSRAERLRATLDLPVLLRWCPDSSSSQARQDPSAAPALKLGKFTESKVEIRIRDRSAAGRPAAGDALREVVGEKTWRIWRVYLAGCPLAFERDDISLFQVLCRLAGRTQGERSAVVEAVDLRWIDTGRYERRFPG